MATKRPWRGGYPPLFQDLIVSASLASLSELYGIKPFAVLVCFTLLPACTVLGDAEWPGTLDLRLTVGVDPKGSVVL